uniref:Bromo domain-containing protein n=1 Tax=Romanomermis culicivorax TaxID=13658 RepID=A0A915JK67_ROMCU
MEHMYGQLEKMVDALKAHPDAEPFLEPVSEDIAPDYKDVIVNPMDLETIEDKLIERKYSSKKEFIEDINLVLLNCLQYNGIYSEYVKTAIKFERTFIKAYKKYFPPTEACSHSERARQEELECISIMGTLDKRVKEIIADMAEAEEEQKRSGGAEIRSEQRTRAKWPRRKVEPGNSESPSTALMEASSSFNAGGQVFAVSSKNDQLTRYCQFVDENGLPADLTLIERALPLLKQMLHDFPKKVSTVMISLDKLDNLTLTRVELSKTSGPPRKAAPSTSSNAMQRTHAQTVPPVINQNFSPKTTVALPALSNKPALTFNRVIIPSIDNDKEALTLPQPGTSFNKIDNYSLPYNRSTANNAISSFQTNVCITDSCRLSYQKPVCSVAPQRQVPLAFSSPPVLRAMQQTPRVTTTSMVQQTQQHQRFIAVPPSTTPTIILAQGQPLLVVNQHPATTIPAVQQLNSLVGQSPLMSAPMIVHSTPSRPSATSTALHARPQQPTIGQQHQPTRLKLTPSALAALGRVLAQQKNQPGRIQISIRGDSNIEVPKDSQNAND